MKKRNRLNSKGMSLIELMIVLVICALLIAGIYRLFVAQGKAYIAQDQVVEVQQNVRSSMEILLRDLRMAGYDDDRTPLVVVPNPTVIPGDHMITIRYEYNNIMHEIRYWADESMRLMRQETKNGAASTETLLDNVDALNLSYGIDCDPVSRAEDGAVDCWENASANIGNRKVVAVRAALTARPVITNPDIRNASPRTLVSTVTFRNLSQMR